ncbi:MAG: hypothetical protein AAFX52_11130 [Pseudomonadota bacterium]
MTDITPAGFTPGRADATLAAGYGSASYGAGVYNLPIVNEQNIVGASVWSLEIWGERLNAVCEPDEVIYEWTPGDPQAVPVANAPTARAILATDQRILLAIGAGGDPRRVEWCDQEDNTNWTPSITNQAGGFNVATPNQLLTGVTVPGGGLLFTEGDCHAFRYLDADQVFGFSEVSSGAGAVSQNAVQEFDGDVLWMGPEGFWRYLGYVQPIACDVADRIYTDINRTQISKVWSFHNASFGEVWWFYPSSSSIECDRYAAYSYRERHWTTGALSRLCGANRSPFSVPLMVAADGQVYDHETGDNYDGARVFLKGGPVTLGSGIYDIQQMQPDERTLGDLQVFIDAQETVMGPVYSYGPFTPAEWTDLRVSGRLISVTFERVAGDFRLGAPLFDVAFGGER